MDGDERTDHGVGLPIAMFLPFLVGASLVVVRDAVGTPVVALALACTVVIGGRLAGRSGGVASAVMAALSFDFFHTVPYRSLKIASLDDVLVTLLLLVVGLAVGAITGASAELRAVAQRRYRATSAVTRVLGVAHDGPLDDVVLAVRAELVKLLTLDDCWLSAAPVDLPVLQPDGGWTPGSDVARDGPTLPRGGVAVPVVAYGNQLGSLVCEPHAGVGVPTVNRRVACALGEVLGLAMSARGAAA